MFDTTNDPFICSVCRTFIKKNKRRKNKIYHDYRQCKSLNCECKCQDVFKNVHHFSADGMPSTNKDLGRIDPLEGTTVVFGRVLPYNPKASGGF